MIKDKRYKFIISTVKKAGELLHKVAAKNIEIRLKNNDKRDIVTNIDIEVGSFIFNEIDKSFANESIYSEEAPLVNISSGSFWTIDPIDGTAPFSRGIPHFAIVIAYVEKGVPIVGAIYNPATDEMFSFQKGKGAYLNGKKVSVSKIKKLSQAYIFFRVGRNRKLWEWGAKVHGFLLKYALKTANFGASALDMCFVGAGRIEACIYGNATPLDISATIGFVREAGGMVVGRGGANITRLSVDKQTIVAVNSAEILTALKRGKILT